MGQPEARAYAVITSSHLNFEDECPATCNKSPECWDARFARVTTPTAESVSNLRLDAPQVRVLPRQRVTSTIQICLDILDVIDVIRFQHVVGTY
ncbi:MAG TPA: hypothetical protein VGF78_07195 [Candidatus Dormibacteraeota bacterium]|jgi:hypothetical protein